MKTQKHLVPISEELIFQRLQFENPWWATGRPEDFFTSLEKRLYFSSFFSLVSEIDIRRAVILMGPRRVGKTVMMHQAISELLAGMVNPRKVYFISIENPIYNNRGLEELFRLSMRACGNSDPAGCYIFFDEVQYLKNWEVHLKSLVDSYPYTKFVVSGSASAALKLKSNESGAGRFTEFKLPPLSFQEYTHLLNLGHLTEKVANGGNFPETMFITHNINELNRHFLDYINFGGYPEVIFSKKIQADPGRYIKSDIIDKVLLRDLPSLYGIRDVQELNSFFTALAYNTGNEFSIESLSASSGVERVLLTKYLDYLEAAFLVKILNRVDDFGKRFKRRTFSKIYLTNTSIRCALFSPVGPNDEHLGNLVETSIISQLFYRQKSPIYYARWSYGNSFGEVDIVQLHEARKKPASAVEIKWSNRYVEKPGELKSMINFCKKNGLGQALVTTIDRTEEISREEINITFVPAALLALSAGYVEDH